MSRTIVILIGIADYQHWSPLDQVETDLRDFRRYAERFADNGPVAVIDAKRELNGQLTAAKLRENLPTWIDDAKPDDDVVILWSGHGEVAGDHYLITGDSPQERNNIASQNALVTSELASWLTQSQAKRNLLIIDTCYAGVGAKDIATKLIAALHSAGLNDGPAPGSEIVVSARNTTAGDGVFMEKFLAVVEGQGPQGHHWNPGTRRVRIDELIEQLKPLLRQYDQDVDRHPVGDPLGPIIPVVADPGDNATLPTSAQQHLKDRFGDELPTIRWDRASLKRGATDAYNEGNPGLAHHLFSAAVALDAWALARNWLGRVRLAKHCEAAWEAEFPGRNDKPTDYDHFTYFTYAALVVPANPHPDNDQHHRDCATIARYVTRLLIAAGESPDDQRLWDWATSWNITDGQLHNIITDVQTGTTWRLIIEATNPTIDQPAKHVTAHRYTHDGLPIAGGEALIADNPDNNVCTIVAELCKKAKALARQQAFRANQLQQIDIIFGAPEIEQIQRPPQEITAASTFGFTQQTLGDQDLIVTHSGSRLRHLYEFAHFDGQTPATPGPQWIEPATDPTSLFKQVRAAGPAIGLRTLPTDVHQWNAVLTATHQILWNPADKHNPDHEPIVQTQWAEFPGILSRCRRMTSDAEDVLDQLAAIWHDPTVVELFEMILNPHQTEFS